ncbi:hypothetical protein MLD38_006401 [Melastoma candidum]|uniref:Uncharacterized protein n=1 Tax=Melastoma candidum TaxID=119954 RepID=A0ACB9RW78_9MYRT|nr:hypothetical protein MLD38_006401 [Melastoma candidum]
MTPPASVNKLLELNLMSAQDLALVSKSMHTYAIAWVHPDRKLTTRVNDNGQANPSWNEKFVLRVNNDSLKNDSCMITIEIMWPSGRKGTINFGVLVINNPIHGMHGELSVSTMAFNDNHIHGGVSKHKMAPVKAVKINLWRADSGIRYVN